MRQLAIDRRLQALADAFVHEDAGPRPVRHDDPRDLLLHRIDLLLAYRCPTCARFAFARCKRSPAESCGRTAVGSRPDILNFSWMALGIDQTMCMMARHYLPGETGGVACSSARP